MRQALLFAVALLVAFAPTPAAWVESLYSQRVYLLIQRLLTPLSSLVPFAVFDAMLLAAVVGLPVWWALALARAGRGTRIRATGGLVVRTAVLASVVYLVFLFVWGLNYRREPLTAKLDFDPERVSQTALATLANEAVERLNVLYPIAHGSRWVSLDELPRVMAPAFNRAQAELGTRRSAVTARPKVTLLTPYFKVAGIDGMVSPFSLEVLVNGAVLPFERPFVVAHEWAHLAGYANEAEASFVGWLTCMLGDSRAQYSGWISLIPLLIGHLQHEQQTALWSRMEDGPLADLRAVSERVSASVPSVRQRANQVYDGYLKANRVEEGIASYGMVVDLVLGTRLGESAGGGELASTAGE